MSINKSNLFIRDYNTIRHILRAMYIYGYQTREDYIADMGISGRKYDMERRRIEAYLPEGFLRKRRVDKKVLNYCTYNALDSSGNVLCETYRNKAVTMLDITGYFFTLQILGEQGELTLTELLEQLPVLNGEEEFTRENLRIKLTELQEDGLIRIRREGNKLYYAVCEDIWENFTEKELLDIYAFLDFLKNVVPVETPFYFLQRKLGLYLRCERGFALPEGGEFVYRHNCHIAAALDNEVLLELMKALHQHRYVLLGLRSGSKEQEVQAVPVRIIHDSTYGRQYLFWYDLKSHKVKQARMEKVFTVKVGEEVPEEEWLEAQSSGSAEDELWCTSGSYNEKTPVIIQFCFDEEKEDFVLNRIQREGHGGQLKRMAPGVYLYTVGVRDPLEMVPWIRSFGERAKVLRSGKFCIQKRIANDWKEAAAKYESLWQDGK